jgi:ElaB/YqjD/DUF883 family membrane-anchored ribosome-binding protein
MVALRTSVPSAKHQYPRVEVKKREIMAEENQMNRGPVESAQAVVIGEQNTRERNRPSVGDQTRKLESGETQRPMKKLTPAARVTGAAVLDDARERLRTLKADTDDYVRKNPAKAVFTALGIAFVLGFMRGR